MKKYKLKAAVPGYISTLQFLILSLKKKVFIAMPINKIKLFSFISLLSLLSVTCKNEVTAVEDNTVPGRRDYVWTVDTLFSGVIQTYMVSMWGSSSKDVWVCGHDGDIKKRIYHFNGKNWQAAQYPFTPFLQSFVVVEGIDSNNVFFGGSALYYDPTPTHNYLDSGLVLQLTYGNWKIDNSFANSIFSMATISSNELWFGCDNGIILKYESETWKTFDIGDTTVLINGIVHVKSNEVYAIGITEKKKNNNEYYLVDYLFLFDGSNWALIDSNMTTNGFSRISFPALMKNINGTLYGCSENNFMTKEKGGWYNASSGKGIS